MKRLLKVLGVLILLILAAAIILPIVFKDEIMTRAKTEINKSLTAEVDFEDINISLFRSFPDFSVNIENTTVDGTGGFEGVRLAQVEDFTVDLNLFSVISGNQFEVERIWISDANIHVIIDADGNANYDIMKATEDTAVADTTGTSDFELQLKAYGLEDVNLIYDDRQGEIYAHLQDLDHDGSGDFTQDIVNLRTETSIEKLTVSYGGITYLNQVNTAMDADFEFNQPDFRITFGENQLRLNQLPVKFTGFVAMPEEDIHMDMAFEAPENQFKNLLSLVPAVYQEDFEDVETSGDFAFNGTVNGTYSEEPETYPEFDLNFNVNNASFRYPDLPAGVENIEVEARVYNETPVLDGTVINIPRANATVAGSPINARLNLSNPMTNPTFEIFLKTDMDLSNIGKVVPASGYDYQGQVMADLDLAGNMNDIDNERYENVKADGTIEARNVVLKSDSLPYDVEVNQLNMDFSPQQVALNSFESRIGRSDLSANGSIENILAYVLQDKALMADFSFSSQLLDLNELTSGMDEGEETEADTGGETESELEIVRIPQNLDVSLNATVKKLIYDNLEIEDVSGNVALNEGVASLNNLEMNMLKGKMLLSGSYDSRPALPEVDMDFKIDNFGFKESYEKLTSIQKLAPIMQNSTGTYSTGFEFQSILNADMTPDYSSVQAQGSLSTRNLQTSPKSLQRLSDILNNPSLATLDVNNVNLDFQVQDGRVEVEPFDLKAANVDATVYGSMGLDQSLDYTMDLQIPVKGIKADDLLNKIGVTQGGKANLKVFIGGTYSDPEVTTSVGDVVEGLKEKAKEKVEEIKKEATEKVNEKAEELIGEAEKRGDELIAEAQKRADQIVAEARKQADNLRSEAEKRASKLEEEAKGNPLKERGAKIAANEIREEADKKAQQLINEAQKRGDNLVKEARNKKQQLIQEAREKGKVGS